MLNKVIIQAFEDKDNYNYTTFFFSSYSLSVRVSSAASLIFKKKIIKNLIQVISVIQSTKRFLWQMVISIEWIEKSWELNLLNSDLTPGNQPCVSAYILWCVSYYMCKGGINKVTSRGSFFWDAFIICRMKKLCTLWIIVSAEKSIIGRVCWQRRISHCKVINRFFSMKSYTKLWC